MSTWKRWCVALYYFNATACIVTGGAALLVHPSFADPCLTFGASALMFWIAIRVY